MAFKLTPCDTSWANIAPFEPAPEGVCCEICGSRYDIGIGPEEDGSCTVCEFHSNMQTKIIRLIRQLQQQTRPSLTKAEFADMRMNSYDRGALIPYMTNELLADQINLTLKNCSRIGRPPSTYDEAIQLYALAARNRMLDPASTKSVDSFGDI